MGAGFPTSPQPTLPGFIAWVRSFMGIPVGAIPDNDVWLTYAYNASVAQVNLQIQQVPGPQYLIAVYNLAGDNLVNWAPDQTSPAFPYPIDNKDKIPYFAFLRDKWNINGFVPGVINASSDVATSQSLTVSEAFDQAQMSDLQNLKTPWGRQYMSIAQKVGSLWGMS